jgi:hypothetical protein
LETCRRRKHGTGEVIDQIWLKIDIEMQLLALGKEGKCWVGGLSLNSGNKYDSNLKLNTEYHLLFSTL